MKKSYLLLVIAISLAVSSGFLPVTIYGQSTSKTSGLSNVASEDKSSVVSVNSSVTVQVTNQTLKDKDAMLRSAVSSFLNSGPNILKSRDGGQDVMTKIVNNVNNATQSLQGTEATNAILGVEISKALKTSVLQSKLPNQADTVIIDTSATCKLAQAKMISCQNSITIR